MAKSCIDCNISNYFPEDRCFRCKLKLMTDLGVAHLLCHDCIRTKNADGVCQFCEDRKNGLVCEYCNREHAISDPSPDKMLGCGRRICETCFRESPRIKCPFCEEWHNDPRTVCKNCIIYFKRWPSPEEKADKDYMKIHKIISSTKCVGTCAFELSRPGPRPEALCYCLYSNGINLERFMKENN